MKGRKPLIADRLYQIAPDLSLQPLRNVLLLIMPVEMLTYAQNAVRIMVMGIRPQKTPVWGV